MNTCLKYGAHRPDRYQAPLSRSMYTYFKYGACLPQVWCTPASLQLMSVRGLDQYLSSGAEAQVRLGVYRCARQSLAAGQRQHLLPIMSSDPGPHGAVGLRIASPPHPQVHPQSTSADGRA